MKIKRKQFLKRNQLRRAKHERKRKAVRKHIRVLGDAWYRLSTLGIRSNWLHNEETRDKPMPPTFHMRRMFRSIARQDRQNRIEVTQNARKEKNAKKDN